MLIGINARYSHPATALYYLREYVKDLPWEIIIREFTIRASVREIIECIEDEKPRCVAFSVYIWNTAIVCEVLRGIGQMPLRPVTVLGGPDAGYNPDEWFASFPADYIISGHGEESFRTLLKHGLDYSGRVIGIKNPPFADIPFPYTENDFEGFAHRKIYYESSRGCAFRCSYCLSSRSDQKLEFRDIVRVKDELDLIMRHSPKLIKFVDRTFNVKGAHSNAVWKHIINSYGGSGCTFHFEVHPGLLTEEDFVLLERCPGGLFQFEIGIQSTYTETLRAVNREGDWERIKPAIKRMIGLGTIHIHVDLIAGLPFEDYNALARSFNEVYSLGADHFQLGYLKILPGTEISSRKKEWGMISSQEPPYEVTETRWLSPEEMRRIKTIAVLVDILCNSHRFKVTLENLPLDDSPFRFFEMLAEWTGGEVPVTWETVAARILESVSGTPGYHFMLDCLRWDMCSASKTNRYPMLVENDILRQNRKEIFSRLRGGWRVPGMEWFDEATAKRSKLFVAESRDFRDKYLGGRSRVFFPAGGLEPVFPD